MRPYSTQTFENAPYLRMNQALEIYPISRGKLTRLAEKAGAIRRCGKTILICRAQLDAYIDNADKTDMLEGE